MELSLLYFLCLFPSALASSFGFELSNSLILPRSNPTSKDGNCGSNSDTNATCLTSTFGNCCSEKGFCGKTSAYCAEGCQEDFGTCSATDGQLGAHLETVALKKGTAVIMKPTVVMVTLSTTTAADETSTSLAASSTDDDASSADSTSTSEPASVTEGQSGSSSSDSLSTGAKAGIAVGAVVGGLGAIGLIAWLVLRRRNKNNAKPAESVAESNEVKPADELRYELHGETRAELPAYEVQR
ncbi:unnamed protein product [Fusarium equiseti]|uniref:Chitin-binding type-1 domain-containing protein n=1 Tax=Fusarium equiseti TaxID=61235 RepID=A0A8J2N9Y4_FUSEQ|nr:unnamed protein product [Fusarium equiseti]